MTLRISSLVENTKAGERLACEPGLSLLAEWRGQSFLVDTGASDCFLDNAAVLGKDLTKLDYVILSHGHSDHSGGVRRLCQGTGRKFQLVLNPRFFDKKFIRDGEYLRYIGNDFDEEFLRIENVATIFPLVDTFCLVEGVYILSAIPSLNDAEKEANDFVVLNGGLYAPDAFADEQIPVFVLPQGLVVIAGCAHRGIINICETAKQRLQKPVFAVIGGLHLKNSSIERIEQTAVYLREEGITCLATGHCTGDNAMTFLEAAGPEILSLASGSVIELADA